MTNSTASEKIIIERIKQLLKRVADGLYPDSELLESSYVYDKDPIPFEKVESLDFKPILEGEIWGQPWGSGWFKFKGVVPERFAGKRIGAVINVDGEACVFRDGEPFRGLTNKTDWYNSSGKEWVDFDDSAKSGEIFELLVEAAANKLFGAGDDPFKLIKAKMCVYEPQWWKFYCDLQALSSLVEILPKNSPRRKKIIHGLNNTANIWNDGNGIDEALQITKKLLLSPANSSSMNAWSIGHAHLDLAWLWPKRETRRKGGRTCATALRTIEEYPEYKFGTSQPQLLYWISQDYPALYDAIKKAVKQGRWECQGAMWVEPDTNIPSGESLVRQCVYGKRFWKKEFGVDMDYLWLPDVFGYSAALPQILKKCGVNYFMTQKISWNEFNKFPHHSFIWEGIDNTGIVSSGYANNQVMANFTRNR